MKNPWNFLPALVFAFAFAGAAHAQNYKWIDKDGKTRYGDTPPAGVKATALGAPASGAASASVAASKDAKKGPLTSAEKDQEFRKRQEGARKDQEKSEQTRLADAEKAENCARSQEYMRTLESGQRIARTNAAGERSYLDESQTAQEIAKTKQTMQQACGN